MKVFGDWQSTIQIYRLKHKDKVTDLFLSTLIQMLKDFWAIAWKYLNWLKTILKKHEFSLYKQYD